MTSYLRYSFLFLLISIAGFLKAQSVEPLPPGETAAGNEPVEKLSANFDRIVLNGLWRFAPAVGSAEKAPSGSWGWIRVPGHWLCEGWQAKWLDGIIVSGKGGGWDAVKVESISNNRPLKVIKQLDRAWYERSLAIPASWSGRQIALRIETPSTDASLYIDGRDVGMISWPGGEVDITSFVHPGKTATLRILLQASPDGRGIKNAMDADRITVSQGVLDHRGLVGDVMLLARPAARVDGFFVKPSVRLKQLGLDVDFVGVPAGTKVALEINAFAADSKKPAKSWSQQITIPAAGPDGRAVVENMTLPWADPVLWDAGKPNLYTLVVSAKGKGIKGEYRERFGFREFWIDGRQMMLNGQVFNFRPILMPSQQAMNQLQAKSIQSFINNNYNIGEFWPSPDSNRGSFALILRHHWTRTADELGFPLIYPLLSPDAWFDATYLSPSAAAVSAWQKQTKEIWRLTRNSPSVLVHVSVGNRFSHGDDQNPRRIGNHEALDVNPLRHAAFSVPGRRLIESYRQIDNTRPIMSHHAADTGDIHTANNYLNFMPMQERREWLSEWARSGDKPFMAVEFGAPFSGTFNRGRDNHNGKYNSEPWLTEFIAIYKGVDAYMDEDPNYRSMIAREHVQGMVYRGAAVSDSSQYVLIQSKFIRDTWLAWRTWGISGGMIAWENANGFDYPPNSKRFDPPVPTPGTLGAYLPDIPENRLGMAAPSTKINTAGHTLIDANNPIQAWISGPQKTFTHLDHIFRVGETITKSATLLNDTRDVQPWSIEWSATVAGESAGSGVAEGTIAPGQPVFSPIAFEAASTSTETQGVITLKAVIAGIERTDSFTFQVLPVATAPASLKSNPYIFDPEGASLSLFSTSGATPVQLKAGALPPPAATLILGRNALKAPAFTPEWAAAITDWVRKGGRLLLLGQDPEWMRERSLFRFTRYVSRHAYPVATQQSHPLLAGLTAEDFRDWRGAGTLIAPEYNTQLDRPEVMQANFRPPTYGWRWGNQGSVASASMEKPHFSAWTPLLENEFDLAFTPLAELALGMGRVIWCGLDLEARSAEEPIVSLLAARLLPYLERAESVTRRTVVYLGGPTGEARLREMGIIFTKVNALPVGSAATHLAVIGADAPGFDLNGWLESDGRVFFLPRPTEAALPFGLKTETTTWSMARTLPDWPEAQGLGLGDLRFRTDQPAVVFSPAENVAADGALARFTKGPGVAILFQLDASALPTDSKTYLRFSQWRLNRATAQLLGNLGASFDLDDQFLALQLPRGQPVPLTGEWKYQVEGELIPGALSPSKPSIDPSRQPGYKRPAWQLEKVDTSAWEQMDLPAMLPQLDKQDGAIWFRHEFETPSEFKGKPLILNLGTLDDFDEVWINGLKVGATDHTTPNTWSLNRVYNIRPGTLNADRNVIAVRLWDQFGGGGFGAARPELMQLELAKPIVREIPYTPGYRTDYQQGDDYTRYYRW